MRLKEALSVLSKSSPYAVSTERDAALSVELDEIKKYLYVPTDVAKALESELVALSSTERKLIFLCGSSGDGKSEILTKSKKEHSNKAEFYFDATHSLSPDATAIETLDELFTNYEEGDKSLVIGINTGMLGNYASEGKVESVKRNVINFLAQMETDNRYVFIDFERYPKFQLHTQGHTSDFVLDIFNKLTSPKDNLIRQYYDKEVELDDSNKRLCANYKLLSIQSVQSVIVDLLFKARMEKEQFLTTRALLDFIYHLLVGEGYLFDNLFSGSDCELINKITDFDPINIRTRAIDNFILNHRLKSNKFDFDIFSRELRNFGINVKSTTSAQSYIRIFYLLKDESFGNNYHKEFSIDFHDDILDEYSKFWRWHWSYDDENKKKIRNLYNRIIIKGLLIYNNRNSAGLGDREFLVRHLNGYDLVSELNIKCNISKVEEQSITYKSNNNLIDVSHFYVHLIVNDKPLHPLRVNINLLSLLNRIVKGYRPNKHDKNTILLLDEVINDLRNFANRNETLYINFFDSFKGISKRYRIEDVERDGSELVLSGV